VDGVAGVVAHLVDTLQLATHTATTGLSINQRTTTMVTTMVITTRIPTTTQGITTISTTAPLALAIAATATRLVMATRTDFFAQRFRSCALIYKLTASS
jgi:hypothetical protein